MLDLKRKANESFTGGEYDVAVCTWQGALSALEWLTCTCAKQKRRPTRCQLEAAKIHCNLAYAFLLLERWEEARSSASEALKIQPRNLKAHFRRAKASHSLLPHQDWQQAVEDIGECFDIDPDNKSVREFSIQLFREADEMLERALDLALNKEYERAMYYAARATLVRKGHAKLKKVMREINRRCDRILHYRGPDGKMATYRPAPFQTNQALYAEELMVKARADVDKVLKTRCWDALDELCALYESSDEPLDKVAALYCRDQMKIHEVSALDI